MCRFRLGNSTACCVVWNSWMRNTTRSTSRPGTTSTRFRWVSTRFRWVSFYAVELDSRGHRPPDTYFFIRPNTDSKSVFGYKMD